MKIPSFDWMGRRRLWFGISLAVTLAGLLSFAVQGLNLSVDFSGGTLWNVRFEQPAGEDAIRDVLADQGVGDAVIQETVDGGGREFIIRTAPLQPGASDRIAAALRERVGAFTLVSLDEVSPTIGGEIRRNALIALTVAIVGMIIYMALRFEYRFALAAIAAVFHDVIVVLGIFSLLRLQVDATFVAAILTIFGYSVNDTVIVFDRIRENLRHAGREPLPALVNRSINQVLVRTLRTGVTTLIALFAIYLFGGETVRNFALALIIGILTGTYSSVAIASPIWLGWRLRDEARRNAAVAR